MSRLLARIMLAIFMLPVAALVWVVVFVILYEDLLRRREEQCFLVSGLVTAAFVGGYWVLLWRRSVRWNAPRLFGSVGLALGAVAVGGLVGWPMDRLEHGLGSFLFGPVTTFAWLVGTVFLWRETRGERASRLDARSGTSLVCPACGYNLTGLNQATCPECGVSYSIDELLASQPGRENSEIERAAA